MGKLLKMSTLASAGALLASFAPAPTPSPSGLAMLDPVRLAGTTCGTSGRAPVLMQRLLIAAAHAAPVSTANGPMPLYQDLTAPRLGITTSSEKARRYFNQGLLLSYGFNHAGAVRSFRAAQQIDARCAACWWGEALALGPNINAPMDDRDREAALRALNRALALAPSASPLERDLIQATALRYVRDPAASRAALDEAYADAMLALASRYKQDDEVAVLAAEAAMDTTPWNYWQADRQTPVGRSGQAVQLIEGVLARRPDHPQAAHLYIHLMENSAQAARTAVYADRLARTPLPHAGHLVHMPGHIYQLLGRQADAIRVNVAAARADEAFIRDTGDTGLVRFGYYPHNVHFIVTSAQLAGDMGTALREAKRLRGLLDPATSASIAWIQAIDAAPFLAMAQFAEPATILAMPEPDGRLPYAAAMRRYARAVAYAHQRDRSGVERELAVLEQMKASTVFAGMAEQGMPASDLVSMAQAVARGRLAYAQGRFGEAADDYRRAIAIEKTLPYQEPPYWYYPVHQSLGAALFKAGRHAEAAQAFRAALRQSPANGWALYGLAESEAAQGHALEATSARKALRGAWLGDPGWLRMDRL